MQKRPSRDKDVDSVMLTAMALLMDVDIQINNNSVFYAVETLDTGVCSWDTPQAKSPTVPGRMQQIDGSFFS